MVKLLILLTKLTVRETSISIDDKWISIKMLLLRKSSTTVKRRWNGSTATLIPAFEGNKNRINILNSFTPPK